MPPSNTDHLDAKLLDNIEGLRDNGSNWEVLEYIDPLNPQPLPKVVSSTMAKPESRSMPTTSNADTIVAWDRGN